MRYDVLFFDPIGRVFSTSTVSAADATDVIGVARVVFRTGIGNGYEIWRHNHLIHTERESPIASIDGTEGEGRTMWRFPPYTVYLRGRDGTIVARQDIGVESDDEAATVAAVVYDACSDVAARSELWCGERRLAATRKPTHVPNASELNERLQQFVLEREQTLRDSRWAVAESRRLLERIAVWPSSKPAQSP